MFRLGQRRGDAFGGALATAGSGIGVGRRQPDDDVAVADQAFDQFGAAVEPLEHPPTQGRRSRR